MSRIEGDYRQFMDKNFIGEWDLPEHGDLVVTISYASRDDVMSERGKDKKLVVHFEEDYKPLIVNATNGNNITEAVGSPKVEKWTGKKIALYREPVQAFGKRTMAVRVRPIPPKETEYFCEDCGELITDTADFKAKSIANSSKKKYGRCLCMPCARAEKERIEAEAKGSDILG